MIEISSLVALIIGEILVGLVIFSGLLLLFTLLRKQRIRKAAEHLAERVQADKAKRSERLKTLLTDGYHLQSPQLDQTLHSIVQTEMTLYQNMLNGFLKDDQVYLQQIDVDVENLVLGYQSLGGFVSQDTSPSASPASSSEEVEELKAENERLAEELKVTMDTMGRMLNEYSTMFADGAEGFPAATVTGASESTAAPLASDTEDEISASVPDDVVLQEESTIDDMAIPDVTEQELTESSLSELNEQSKAEDDVGSMASADTTAEVDEEVSEIIDEVMEIADDMIHEAESMQNEPESVSKSDAKSETLPDSEQMGESMVDDLNKIDIDIPDVEDSDAEQTEFEPGSLEEEWAKLLEEESVPDEGTKGSK
jgi:hypothetical protein